VVDIDPQANAASGLGVDTTDLRGTMYDVVLGFCDGYPEVPIREIIIETAVKNLHLAPSELDLSVAESMLHTLPQRTQILASSLKSVLSLYDYILIDVPPHMGLLMTNGLYAAQQLIIPVEPSIYALEALEAFAQFVDDARRAGIHSFDRIMVVLVRYAKLGGIAWPWRKPGNSQQVENILRGMYDNVFTIPESPIFFEAQRLGLPISHCAPTSPAVSAYKQLTAAVQGRQ
jgi:chromosome partitioning protein